VRIDASRILGFVWLLSLFLLVMLALRAHYGGALSLDVTIAKQVQALPTVLGAWFDFENWGGDGLPLALVVIAGSLLLLARGHRLEAALLAGSFLIRAADVAVKHLVLEPRPSPDLVRVSFPHDDLSFPSGHVIGVTLVFGLLAAFLPRLTSSPRLVLAGRILCGLLIATIGLARIWAGAHWPSDVLGGYLYALVFLLPLLLLASTVNHRLEVVSKAQDP
jgi:undecaprenyl-diphosphatase